MIHRESHTVDNANNYKVTAALHCEQDAVVSRDQVCRSSQYGVIDRKGAGSGGSGGGYTPGSFGTPLGDANRYSNIIEVTFDTGGWEAYDADGQQPTPSGKHGWLPAEKVNEIEHWLTKIDPEGDDGSLEA